MRLAPSSRFAVALGAMLLVGCRDTPRANVLSPAPESVPQAGPIKARLHIERDPADSAPASPTTARNYLVTLRLEDAATAKVGSITAAVDFDSTRVRYVGDASGADTSRAAVLRAVHLDRGRVRIAAASVTGLPHDLLARLRFTTRDTLALRSLRLTVSEVHALDAGDLSRALTVSAPTLYVAPAVGGGRP